MSKIDWSDVGERALKTAAQAAFLALVANAAVVRDGLTTAAVWTLAGIIGGAAISAAWNVIEDAVKEPPPPPEATYFPQ